ncbi:MAG: hypothetical protein ACRC92_23940 [Peptostreptococcaceae bacterium]
MKLSNMKEFITEAIATLHDASGVIESAGDYDDRHTLQEIDSTLSGLLNIKSNMEVEIPEVDLPRIINTSQLIGMGVSKEDIESLPVSFYAITSNDVNNFLTDVVPENKLAEVTEVVESNIFKLYNSLSCKLVNSVIVDDVVGELICDGLTDILGYNPTDLEEE